MALRPETLAAQALHTIDAATGAIVPPLHASTTYARDPNYGLVDGRDYTRDKNPTVVPVEQLLTTLEGGADSLTFASGMAAATTVFRALLRPGDHVVTPRVAYFALRGWID